MAMDREFSWNRGVNTAPVKNPAYEAAQAALAAQQHAQQAAAVNTPVSYNKDAYRIEDNLPALMSQAQQGMQAQAANEAQRAADLQRLAELKAKREKKISDPKTRMAAMLAMAGQTGAMQSILSLDNSSKANSIQSDMDALEEKIAADVLTLASAKKEDRERIATMMRSIYGDKFKELEQKGGRSRMGGWEGWLNQLNFQIGKAKSNADAAAARKAGIKRLMPH